MNILLSPINDTIVLITAIINIVCLLLLFFTCRFIPRLRLTNPLAQKRWYKPMYKFHSYIWWLFIISVAVHAILAILNKLVGG
jgi:hypothetical protein